METLFAPAERASGAELAAEREGLARFDHLNALLDVIPDCAFALNRHRQIIGAGKPALQLLGLSSVEEALGARPGEALDCVHSDECLGGCGTSASCSLCGAVEAILECLETRQTVERECRIVTRGSADGGALNLRVRASYTEVNRDPLVLLAIRDISGDKRREVLEHALLDNLYTGVIAVHQLAQLVRDETDNEAPSVPFTADLLAAARGILDELDEYRYLRSAENDDLKVRLQELYLPELTAALTELFAAHPQAKLKSIAVRDVARVLVSVDVPLALRAFGNLILNALEATPAGGHVTISASEVADGVAIEIHNQTAMPSDVQLQVFQRSFSTKGRGGRGLGTYSSRLYIERYLGGGIDFVSNEHAGTTFRVTLPAISIQAA